MTVTLADLQALHDFPATEAQVEATVEAAANGGPADLLRFLGRFIWWNGGFGPGVASLAAKIGRSRSLFHDPTEPLAIVGDRSVHIGSYVFDAARDEYDDGATRHRDTHRTLGQAAIKGIVRHLEIPLEQARDLLEPPEWLLELEGRTQSGYGVGTPDDLGAIGHAMGFHLGSEILADEEFTTIDRTLRRVRPDLVQALLRLRVHVADQDHPAYYWIGIHSGHGGGGGVEADHFEWAVQGVREAFRYTPAEQHEALRSSILAGFQAFAACHTTFFARALT